MRQALLVDLQAKVCHKDHTTDLMQEIYWGWKEQKAVSGYMRDRDTQREQEGQNKRVICDDDDVAAGTESLKASWGSS